MKNHFKLFLFFIVVSLLAAACSANKTPSLAVAEKTTLVFVYTDG